MKNVPFLRAIIPQSLIRFLFYLGVMKYNKNLDFSVIKYSIYQLFINTTKYWLRAIFKENELASSPLILHKVNILWY